MFRFASFALIAALSLSAKSAFAFGPLCERYMANRLNVNAIVTVAQNLQYSNEQLCSLPQASAIQIDHTTLLDENQRPIPHTWLTIHYGEYSCQYYVRDDAYSITKSNCYGTW